MAVSSKHSGWHKDVDNARLDFYYNGTRIGHINATSFRTPLGSDSEYFLLDAANKLVYSTQNPTPSGSAYFHQIVANPQAITALADGSQKYCGFRNGALNVQVIRASGQAFAATWDGNADEGVKVIARNYGNGLDGVTRIGGARALNIQARNSGTNISWVKSAEINARNDSGKNTTDLLGVHIRCENYGNIYTSNIGLDIEMSDENTTQSQTRTAMQIRNTDASAMSAVENVLKVSHSGTNGFTNLIHFNGTTGDTIAAGHVHDSASANVLCDYVITCKIDATTIYIPCFDTLG